MATPPRKDSSNGKPEIRTLCPNCGMALIAEAKDAGRKAKCPDCGSGFVIAAMPSPPVREAARISAQPPETGRKGVSDTSLRLREEADAEKDRETDEYEEGAEETSEPSQAEIGPTIMRAPLVTTESHRTRAQMAGWLRRVVIVAVGLAVIKVFEAAFTSIPVRTQTTLHASLNWIITSFRTLSENLHLLSVPRVDTMGTLTPLERFILALGMLLFATCMMVRAKLIDTVYVVTPRWKERSMAGLVINFLAFLLQAGLLAWTASATKLPNVSDGLACGLVAVMLLVSGLWLATLHLMAGHEYPELTKWMATDVAFALMVFLVVLWPGLTVLWTRAGATGVLLLANAAVALHVGTSFVFARRPRRWWWHKPVSIVVSAALVLLAAVLMACSR